MHLSRFWISVMCLFLAPAALGAQQVRGVFSEEVSGEPIAGAIISLEAEGGAASQNTLTDAFGTFTFRAPAAGRYRLRAERIGFAPLVGPYFEIAAGEAIERNLVGTSEAITLDGIIVSSGRQCVGRGVETPEVHRIWDEARKSLTAVALTEQLRFVTFRTEQYQRDLDLVTSRVEWEQTTPKLVMNSAPFRSPPAAELISSGFVRMQADTTLYFGPDAAVLLSDEFQQAHCFSVRQRGAPREGLIGLAFAPVRSRMQSYGVEGVLWLDEWTSELESLSFSYTRLPVAAPRHRFGGEMAFQRLANGAWIVKEWVIRMPRPKFVYERGRAKLELGIREDGGTVEAVDQYGHALDLRQPLGRITGVVLDGEGHPVSGTAVYLNGTSYTAETGEDGRFVIHRIRPGHYEVRTYHPELDPQGQLVEPAVVAIGRGGERELRFHLPGLTEQLAMACGEGQTGRVIVGVVTDRLSGMVMPGSQVSLTPSSGGTVTQVSTDERGYYRFCDVPTDAGLVLRADFGGFTSAEQAVAVSGTGRAERFDLALDVSGPGTLLGQVLDADTGEPISAAALRIEGTEFTALSDRRGNFRIEDVPPGDHTLEVRHLAYGSQTADVAVRGRQDARVVVRLGVRAIAIEGITVRATPRDFAADFHFRREQGLGGTFITREELDERSNSLLIDELQARGLAVPNQGSQFRGRDGFVLSRYSMRGCEPAIYVDGVRVMPPDASVTTQSLHPRSIEGVEVYMGAATIPAEFGGSTAQCGVVAIWMRRGMGRQGQ